MVASSVAEVRLGDAAATLSLKSNLILALITLSEFSDGSA